MAQNDPHIAALTKVEFFSGKHFSSAPTSVVTQDKGPGMEAHSSNPLPPPSAGVGAPPRRASFRSPCCRHSIVLEGDQRLVHRCSSCVTDGGGRAMRGVPTGSP